MEEYQDAVTDAIILIRATHDTCGFYQPAYAYVLKLHLRRLKRLEKAIKKHINSEYTITDSTDSEDSNHHTPYPRERPGQKKGGAPNRHKPNPTGHK